MSQFARPFGSNLRTLCAVAVLCSAGLAQAQYKWVAPDGTVTYGDKPPIAEVQASRVGGMPGGSGSGNANLPYALRTVADKYPVTLYTTSDCGPCDQARAHLGKRGVPFTEKSVKTPADIQAMNKLGLSDGNLPVMLVGRQKQVGFEAGSFDGLLDSAGYPKTSMLPANYRPAEASRLAEASSEPAATKPQTNTAQRQPTRRERNNNTAVQTSAAPSAPSAENPNGLRF